MKMYNILGVERLKYTIYPKGGRKSERNDFD